MYTALCESQSRVARWLRNRNRNNVAQIDGKPMGETTGNRGKSEGKSTNTSLAQGTVGTDHRNPPTHPLNKITQRLMGNFPNYITRVKFREKGNRRAKLDVNYN